MVATAVMTMTNTTSVAQATMTQTARFMKTIRRRQAALVQTTKRARLDTGATCTHTPFACDASKITE